MRARDEPPGRRAEHVAAQRHGRLAAQNRSGGLAERERAVLALRRQDSAREELADHAAPVLVGQVGAETIRRQGVVTLLTDAVGGGSAQDVDQMAGTEGLAALALEADDRRQQLLRGDRAVPGLWGLEARVAVAARSGCLTE